LICKVQNHEVYVAEIEGRGIDAFHVDNGPDAKRLMRDRVFRDDLMVLATGGLPPWDGVTDIEVRHPCPDEKAKWWASRAKAIRLGNIRGERCLMDRFPRCTHRPTKT
jgi:hypothetical protein